MLLKECFQADHSKTGEGNNKHLPPLSEIPSPIRVACLLNVHWQLLSCSVSLRKIQRLLHLSNLKTGKYLKRPRWGKECICLGMYCYFEILRLLEHPSGFLRRPHTWFSLEVMEMMTDGPFLSLQFCRLKSPQERLIGSGESRSGLLPGLEAMVPKKTWISGFLTLSIAHPKVYYDRRFWSIQIGLDHFTLQNPQQQQQSGCWFIGN